MTTSIPTRGQLERTLAQRIQSFYRNQLGHRPSKVSCQLFEQKLVIIIEDAVTPAEHLLAQQGQEELAEQVRSTLDEVTQPQIKESIEEVLRVEVIDLLSDATLETSRTGIIAILSANPQVRNPESIPGFRARRPSARSNDA
jgi:uncharacterized protein YbcI